MKGRPDDRENELESMVKKKKTYTPQKKKKIIKNFNDRGMRVMATRRR
jgi:hypothetical protein